MKTTAISLAALSASLLLACGDDHSENHDDGHDHDHADAGGHNHDHADGGDEGKGDGGKKPSDDNPPDASDMSDDGGGAKPSETDAGGSHSDSPDAGDAGADAGAMNTATMATEYWVLSADTEKNEWHYSVFEPAAGVVHTEKVAALAKRTAAKAEALEADDVGPAWGDIIGAPYTDFVVANAGNADSVVVFDAAKREISKIVDLAWGARPLHAYNPLHGTEVWPHLDGLGAYLVINGITGDVLAGENQLVQATSASVGRGHGKLLYAEELGVRHYSTNTAEPGIFPISGKTRKTGDIITVCASAPEDDPETTEDESLGAPVGGTHDKAYLPGIDLVAIQCTRGKGYSFVNPIDNSVAADQVAMSGSIAHSPGNEFVLAINAGAAQGQIQVWEANDDASNGYAFDWVVSVDGEPSARGTHFRFNAEAQWEAWIPQTGGTKLAVLNLETRKVKNVEIGTLTAPEGASHFSRRGAIGPAFFVTYNDDGMVLIDVESHKVTEMDGVGGSVSRLFSRTYPIEN